MSRNDILHIIIPCGIVLLFSLHGCKSAKSVSNELPPSENVGTIAPSLDASPEEGIKVLFDSYQAWQDVSMSIKCRLRQPMSLSISGRATMIRGKEIYISLRMLGMEVAGLYADSDSIYLYEKLNRTMLVEPLSRISSSSGLTLSDLQDLLIGRICYPGATIQSFQDAAALFIITGTGNTIQLAPKQHKDDKTSWAFTILGGSSPTLMSTEIHIANKGDAICQYLPALLTPVGPASPSATLTAKVGRQTLDASIDWSLERAEWDKGLTPTSRVPKGYSRMSLDKLLKSFPTF